MYLKMKGSFGRKEEEGRALASAFTVYSSGYRRWCWRRRMLMEHGLVVHSEWCLEWGGEALFMPLQTAGLGTLLLALPVSCTEPHVHVVELDTPIHTPHQYTHTPSIILPVPTRPLYLPDPVPTRSLYLPDPCTYQTPVPTRPLYLPDPCTYQTPVPTRPLYLPDPCTRPLYLPDPRLVEEEEEEEEEEDNMEEEEKEEEEEEEEERI